MIFKKKILRICNLFCYEGCSINNAPILCQPIMKIKKYSSTSFKSFLNLCAEFRVSPIDGGAVDRLSVNIASANDSCSYVYIKTLKVLKKRFWWGGPHKNPAEIFSCIIMPAFAQVWRSITHSSSASLWRDRYSTIPTFETDDPDSIPGGDRNFNLWPDILITADYWIIEYCLVFWSIVSGSPYRYLIHRHLDCKSRECKSYIMGA